MSRCRFAHCLALCLVVFAVRGPARAEEPPEGATKEIAAIRAATQAYLEALKRGDAKALLSAWTAEGDYVDQTGRTIKARELIQERFPPDAPPVPSDDRAVPTVTADSIRLITADLAIEDGTLARDGASAAGRYTAIWVKQGGKWLLDAVREASAAASDASDELAQLAWMVGDWIGETDDQKLEVSTRWSDDKHFLLRETKVHRGKAVDLTGTQRIGWDPLTRSIKSWAFDSTGGHSEGRWSQDGDVWVVQTTGVLPDGRQTSAIHRYIIGEEGITWRAIDANVDGQPMPDLTVAFTRKKAD